LIHFICHFLASVKNLHEPYRRYILQKRYMHIHMYMYTYICKSKTWGSYFSFLGHFCMVFMLIVLLCLIWLLRCHTMAHRLTHSLSLGGHEHSWVTLSGDQATPLHEHEVQFWFITKFMLVLVISEISRPSCEVATSLATTLELPIIDALWDGWFWFCFW